MSQYTVVDLFCGAGAASRAWSQRGFEIRYAADSCKWAVAGYTGNLQQTGSVAKIVDLTKNIPANIHDIKLATRGSPDVLFLNPPASASCNVCFSYVLGLRPRVFVLVGTPAMLGGPWFKGFERRFIDSGYGVVCAEIGYRKHLGLPPSTKKVLLVGAPMVHLHNDRERLSKIGHVLMNAVRANSRNATTMRQALGGLATKEHYFCYPRDGVTKAIISMSEGSNSVRASCLNNPPGGYTRRRGDSSDLSSAQLLGVRELLCVQGLPPETGLFGPRTSQAKQLASSIPEGIVTAIAMTVKAHFLTLLVDELTTPSAKPRPVSSKGQFFRLNFGTRSEADTCTGDAEVRVKRKTDGKPAFTPEGKRARLSKMERILSCCAATAGRDHEPDQGKNTGATEARNLGVKLSFIGTGPARRRKLMYTKEDGATSPIDSVVDGVSGFRLPVGWTLTLKERVNKRHAIEDISWTGPERGKVFRSRVGACEYIRNKGQEVLMV